MTIVVKVVSLTWEVLEGVTLPRGAQPLAGSNLESITSARTAHLRLALHGTPAGLQASPTETKSQSNKLSCPCSAHALTYTRTHTQHSLENHSLKRKL